MASNSYYNDQSQVQPYQNQIQCQDQYSSQGQQGQGQTFADQVYPDGSRDQQYDAQGNPVLPNGERGLLTDLIGAGAGGYLGHKQGHGIMGALAGGIGAHLLSNAMGGGKHSGGHHSGGGGMMGSMMGGMGGGMLGSMLGGGGRRRDIDGNELPDDGTGYGQVDQQQYNQNQNQQYDQQYSQQQQPQYDPQYQGQQQYDQPGQYGGYQGQGQDPNQTYGSNYGR